MGKMTMKEKEQLKELRKAMKVQAKLELRDIRNCKTSDDAEKLAVRYRKDADEVYLQFEEQEPEEFTFESEVFSDKLDMLHMLLKTAKAKRKELFTKEHTAVLG